MGIPNNQPTFLPEATFVAFDTETTGMWAPINRIVEIAAVKFRLDSEVISTFQSLVNHLMTIPAEVIDIKEITDEMVRDAPRVDEALVRFMEFCGGESVLVAHNADDQVETVLMHLLRGSGLGGLRGMQFRSIQIQFCSTIPLIRPLLSTGRA